MLLLTAVVAIYQLATWFGPLPGIVPSHFDAQGNADDEMGKGLFVGLFVMLHAVFLVGFPLLGVLIKKLPASMINIPNREYWLAPERRESTVDYSTQFLWLMGWLSSWLMIGLFQLTALVAIGNRQTIEPEFIWMIGLYLATVAVMTATLCFRFRLPAEAKLQPVENG